MKPLKQAPKANERLMPIHKQIALGKKPTAPKISNPPKKAPYPSSSAKLKK